MNSTLGRSAAETAVAETAVARARKLRERSEVIGDIRARAKS